MQKEEKRRCAEEQDIPKPRDEMKEDILEMLCRWNRKNMVLTPALVCQHFGLSKWTLNMYLKMLYKDRYIEKADDSGTIRLTEYGRTIGQDCEYRHETLSQFLQLVGVEREYAETAACRMEHVVGEEAVDCICRFVNYGNTYERILKNNSLQNQYEPGTYQFLSGIYQMERCYPRKLAPEQNGYRMEILLEVREEAAWFELITAADEEKKRQLWYYEERRGWMRAEKGEHGSCIPAAAFEYIIRPEEKLTEGTVMIAFTEKEKEPGEKNCRELEVDIW